MLLPLLIGPWSLPDSNPAESTPMQGSAQSIWIEDSPDIPVKLVKALPVPDPGQQLLPIFGGPFATWGSWDMHINLCHGFLAHGHRCFAIYFGPLPPSGAGGGCAPERTTGH